MMDSLGNVQSVLLVGGTSEIGHAILTRLAQGNRLQRIVLLGRNEQALETVAQRWRDAGVETSVVVADLAAEIDVPVLTSRCFESGDIDVVIMAAGITPDSEVESDAELVRRVAMVNFVSQMQLGTELARDCDCRATGRWSSCRRWPWNAPEPTTTCTARPRAVWMRGPTAWRTL
ncbi:MAG: SDR family NAD(P)-dependent oxidoreductase [Micrococcales bacterium]|nr:SDR family NAD(P)-dependent oxidoreductase [Micrococcales bacterium]